MSDDDTTDAPETTDTAEPDQATDSGAPESASTETSGRRTVEVPSWAPRALAVAGVLLIALVGFVVGRATDGDGSRDFRPAFSQRDRGQLGPDRGPGRPGGPGNSGRQLPGGPGGPGDRDRGERGGQDEDGQDEDGQDQGRQNRGGQNQGGQGNGSNQDDGPLDES